MITRKSIVFRLCRAAMFTSMIVPSACSSSSTAENGVENGDNKSSDDVDWRSAPENSMITGGVTRLKEGAIGAARRCWKRGEKFDCLYLGMAGPMYTAKRFQIPKLNSRSSDDIALASFAGYTCRFFPESGLVEESIGNDSDFLTKNTVSLKGELAYTAPWTAEHVNAYIKDNKIAAADTHFDCVELASQIFNGSFDSVGTTSVRYDQLMH